MKSRTMVQRKSERELVVTRTFNGPARIVFESWTKPALLNRIEVTPHSRLVWTNEESDDGAVTTVTFEERGGKTLVVMHELYPPPSRRWHRRELPSREQLDELLVTLGASVRRS